MEPSRTAALCVRWQIWRATSLVTRVVAGWPMYWRVCCTWRSERMCRKGDCASCAARPCRRAPSKTASPVVFVKSARTMEPCPVSFGPRCVKKYAPAASTIMLTAAAVMRGQRLPGATCDGCAVATATEAEDGAPAIAVADVTAPAAGCAVVMGAALVPPDGVIAAIAWPLEGAACKAVSPNAPEFCCDMVGCADGTAPETRLEPESRFRRARSVRSSAAC